jgi:hypothetical protein
MKKKVVHKKELRGPNLIGPKRHHRVSKGKEKKFKEKKKGKEGGGQGASPWHTRSIKAAYAMPCVHVRPARL